MCAWIFSLLWLLLLGLDQRRSCPQMRVCAALLQYLNTYQLFPFILFFSYLYWMVTCRLRHFAPRSSVWPVWNVLISTTWMTKNHGCDICGVRSSTQDIRTWSNISWQLWLIKCLTLFFLQLMQIEHKNLAIKGKRQNSSPGTTDQVKTFKIPPSLTVLSGISLPPITPVLLVHLVKILGKHTSTAGWVCPYRKATTLDTVFEVLLSPLSKHIQFVLDIRKNWNTVL